MNGGRFLCKFCPATFATLYGKHEHGREKHTIAEVKPESAIVMRRVVEGEEKRYTMESWPAPLDWMGAGPDYGDLCALVMKYYPTSQPIGRARTPEGRYDSSIVEAWV